MATGRADARGRGLLVAGWAMAGLSAAAWLVAAGLFVHAVTSEGSPPRIAEWDGPAEDDNLPDVAFLLEDEAWLVRSGRIEGVETPSVRMPRDHRLVIIHVDLPRGVAETGWDLVPMLEGRRARVRGVARRGDGGISLVLADGRGGLRAVSLLPDRSAVDHGLVEVDTLTATLGATWEGGRLRCALGDGRAATWGEGDPRLEPIEGCPRVDRHDRDTWLAAARWTDAGWDVLVWEAPGAWRWTLATEEAAAPGRASHFGGLSLASPPFDDPIPVGPPGRGDPPNPEVRGRGGCGVLRSTGRGHEWACARAAGGFWDWCMPHGERWVCVTHRPFEDWTRIFDGEGHDRTSEVHGRFGPADPVIVEASAGGFWVLDLSNVSEDGRIYYRLRDDLTRADPMSWLERYRRVRPRSAEEVWEFQATGGPSVMTIVGRDEVAALHLFLSTIELPVELFGFPLCLALLLLLRTLMRLDRRSGSLLSALLFGLSLLVALASMRGYLSILRFL